MLRVHSIETLGALDGPGLRTVVFLCGCPMRCKYCHNPDICAAEGELWSTDRLADFCARYKPYYGSEGGVTLSGGEPLLQADQVAVLLRALKTRGIHTAVDTGGGIFAPEALEAADLAIVDIKHTDPDAFFTLTGVGMGALKHTISFLAERRKRFWVRQVIVPGINDSEEQVRALKTMAVGAERIELLPYHTLGVHKWEKLGMPYALQGVQPPDADTMRRLNDVLKA